MNAQPSAYLRPAGLTHVCDTVKAMSLPVSKTALDRLGSKLIAGDHVVETDRVALAQVVGAYQQALDEAKVRLRELGYPCTTRVKTTGTLIEKLRREAPMRLSQVQDLAGARIVVHDRLAQDDAVRTIRDDCVASGRSWKLVDRRDRPSYGYRAVHIIMSWDRIPIEVQVRTELQDTWAQMTERIADKWGRGIRYGDDPDSPRDSPEPLKVVELRRSMIGSLATLGDLIAQSEVQLLQADSGAVALESFGRTVKSFEQSRAGDLRIARDAFSSDILDSIVEGVERLCPESRAAMEGSREMPVPDFAKALHQAQELARQKNDDRRETLRRVEDRMRVILQGIADKADRKEL